MKETAGDVASSGGAGIPPTEPPRATLTRMLMGQAVARALYVAARLGIADLLAGGPRPVDELAEAVGADAGALARLLRALAGSGVFAEVAPGRFGLTPLGDCLREDRPDSARPAAILYGEEYSWALDGLLKSVRTGAPAFEHVGGASFFAYLEQYPEVGARFDRNMSSRNAARNAAVSTTYDFEGITTLVDVGGGEGALLQAVLAEFPALQGILFDLPPVIERARRSSDQALHGRLELVAGDAFVSVPTGADAYLLAWVLHDWDDERALAILRGVRRVIPRGGRLLVVEEVLPPGDVPSPTRLLDLLMLTLVGGKERTEEEFRELLAAAGFALSRIIPTTVGVSVIEARPIG